MSPPVHGSGGPGAGLRDYLRALPQYLLPHHALSRLMLRLTRSRVRWLKDLLIRQFIRLYRVDMSQALQPDPAAYPDFNSFFTRALKPGMRPVVTASGQLACPADGRISQVGGIEAGRLFQAKGRYFGLQALLGGAAELAAEFDGGSFATVYLSPQDYHRVHMPLSGRLREMLHVPGRIFSVSPATTRVVPELFARNERVISVFDTEAGPMAVILVGAIFVASIETVWSGVVTPPTGKLVRRWDYREQSPPPLYERGQELGRFNMGSTVILLFGPGAMQWEPALQPDARVQMGQRLGRLRAAAGARQA